MTIKQISEKTAIPISLLIVIISAVFYFGKLATHSEADAREISRLDTQVNALHTQHEEDMKSIRVDLTIVRDSQIRIEERLKHSSFGGK